MQEITTLLAQAQLHLPLYKELLDKVGNVDGFQVLTLAGALSRLLSKDYESRLALLFHYKERLEKALSPDNAFYGSTKDYDFLMGALSFMTLVQLYDLKDFPKESEKERDLYEIISSLQDIDLWQKEAKEKLEKESDLAGCQSLGEVEAISYYNDASSLFFLDLLKEKGRLTETASALSEKEEGKDEENALEKERYYYSVSNIRKGLEWIAREILDQNYQADDIQIILANPSDRYYLEQIFNYYQIPFTFLEEEDKPEILRQYIAALEYIQRPEKEQLLKLIKAFYPHSGQILLDYLEHFDEFGHLDALEYIENPLITKESFFHLQSLEAQAKSWIPVLEDMQQWDTSSLLAILEEIQALHPEPEPKEIELMDQLLDDYYSIAPKLADDPDGSNFDLYVQSIKHLQTNQPLESFQGVLAGSSKSLGLNRKILFYAGISASNFPFYSLAQGLFDEAYLAKLDFPSLESRMERQKEDLLKLLDRQQIAYFITPQSDLEGKNIEASHDLERYLNKPPLFKEVHDPIGPGSARLALSGQIHRSLFEKEGMLSMSSRALDVFKKCPYKHFLQYGLHLRSSHYETERLLSNKLIKPILQRVKESGLALDALSFDEMLGLVEEQYEFLENVYPDKEEEFEREIYQDASKLLMLFKHLALYEKAGLSLVPESYAFSIAQDEYVISGSLGQGARQPFSLYAPEQSLDPEWMETPLASLVFDLKDHPISLPARSTNRSGGKINSAEIAGPQKEGLYINELYSKAALAHDLEEKENLSPLLERIKSKSKSYRKTGEDLQADMEQFIACLQIDEVSAEHAAQACKYCSFKAICRDRSRERERG